MGVPEAACRLAALQAAVDDPDGAGEARWRPRDGAVAVPLHPEPQRCRPRDGAVLFHQVGVVQEVQAQVVSAFAIVAVTAWKTDRNAKLEAGYVEQQISNFAFPIFAGIESRLGSCDLLTTEKYQAAEQLHAAYNDFSKIMKTSLKGIEWLLA